MREETIDREAKGEERCRVDKSIGSQAGTTRNVYLLLDLMVPWSHVRRRERVASTERRVVKLRYQGFERKVLRSQISPDADEMQTKIGETLTREASGLSRCRLSDRGESEMARRNSIVPAETLGNH